MAGKNPFAKVMKNAKAPLDYAKGKVPEAMGRPGGKKMVKKAGRKK